MRTTIELPDELRERLLAVAAMRGEKGYSQIIVEALEKYLDEIEVVDQRQRLSRLRGVWSDEEAEEVARSVKELRSHWTL